MFAGWSDNLRVNSGPRDAAGVRDPDEGVAVDGTIRTGVGLDRVPTMFRPVVAQATSAVLAEYPDVSVLLYGSVATGQAEVGRSDVDLLTVGLPAAAGQRLGAELSARFGALCRGVELATSTSDDLCGEDDRSYGNRVFLRHYCALVAGPDPAIGPAAFLADVRAARGFNGDIAGHARRWRERLAAVRDPAVDPAVDVGQLARRIGRKTLFAVAGLVSVHDSTWTTDRSGAAARWAQVAPDDADGLATLLAWSGDGPCTAAATQPPDPQVLQEVLDTTVASVVSAFAGTIGLWSA